MSSPALPPVGDSGVFDTSALLDLLRGRPSARRCAAEIRHLFAPAAAFGELWTGVWKSGQPDKKAAELRLLRCEIGLLPIDEGVAEAYGQLRAQLERAGRPSAANDLWMAATAVHHRLPLVARDRHFAVVEGLRLWPLPAE